MPKKAENFIKDAIKRPGALRAKAKRAGGLTKKGTISKAYLAKAAKSGSKLTKQQVNLARTLRKVNN